jgi:hypothetical protein
LQDQILSLMATKERLVRVFDGMAKGFYIGYLNEVYAREDLGFRLESK